MLLFGFFARFALRRGAPEGGEGVPCSDAVTPSVSPAGCHLPRGGRQEKQLPCADAGGERGNLLPQSCHRRLRRMAGQLPQTTQKNTASFLGTPGGAYNKVNSFRLAALASSLKEGAKGMDVARRRGRQGGGIYSLRLIIGVCRMMRHLPEEEVKIRNASKITSARRVALRCGTQLASYMRLIVR